MSRKLAAIILVFLFSSTAWTNPTAEEIQNLSRQSQKIIDEFYKDSFDLRMKFEYYGAMKLSTEQTEKLKELALKAREELITIEQNQQKLKQQIEDYEGEDWDQRYGVTGLWKKVQADIGVSETQRARAEYYLFIAGYVRLGSVQHITLSGVESDIQKIKISRDKEKLREVIANIAESQRYDTELILSALFLQRRIDPNEFQNSFKMFDKVQGYVTKLIWEDMSELGEEKLDNHSVFEAELAARDVWGDQKKEGREFLKRLLGIEKFQTAFIYYVAAVKFWDDEPKRAIEYLIKASQIRMGHKESALEVEADKIAEQGCKLGYNLYSNDKANCQVAIEAFENYEKIATKENYGQLEYLYSVVLDGCGEKERRKEILKKLAESGEGIWRSKAKLALITERLDRKKLNEKQRGEVLGQLKELISLTKEGDGEAKAVSFEAKLLYCKELLRAADVNSASEVLGALEDEKADAGAIWYLRARAFSQIGKVEAAIDSMAKAVDCNDGDYRAEGMRLLGKIAGEIEKYISQDGDSKQFVKNCRKIAEYCYERSNGEGKDGIYLAELLILQDENEAIVRAEEILQKSASNLGGDEDLVRCRAMLRAAKGEYEQAAKEWSAICQLRKNETTDTKERSWQWWQAKYYELLCWSKCDGVEKSGILHSIEVLKSSFENVPQDWGKKIEELEKAIK